MEPGIRENGLQVWGPEQEDGHTLCRQNQKMQACEEKTDLNISFSKLFNWYS